MTHTKATDRFDKPPELENFSKLSNMNCMSKFEFNPKTGCLSVSGSVNLSLDRTDINRLFGMLHGIIWYHGCLSFKGKWCKSSTRTVDVTGKEVRCFCEDVGFMDTRSVVVYKMDSANEWQWCEAQMFCQMWEIEK